MYGQILKRHSQKSTRDDLGYVLVWGNVSLLLWVSHGLLIHVAVLVRSPGLLRLLLLRSPSLLLLGSPGLLRVAVWLRALEALILLEAHGHVGVIWLSLSLLHSHSHASASSSHVHVATHSWTPCSLFAAALLSPEDLLQSEATDQQFAQPAVLHLVLILVLVLLPFCACSLLLALVEFVVVHEVFQIRSGADLLHDLIHLLFGGHGENWRSKYFKQKNLLLGICGDC